VKLTQFVGPAYRAVTGFRLDRSATAGDVVRYEQGELGNDLGISACLTRKLDKFPAAAVVWVCRTVEEAKRYGEIVAKVELPENPVILAEDSEGGYLVFRGFADNLKGNDANEILDCRGANCMANRPHPAGN